MENKKLKSLNKIIKKGRVKFSLHMALAMTAGFGIAKIFTGGFANWLLFGAFVSFIFIFILSYFLMWPRYINKAEAMLSELDGDEIASPPAHKSIGSWLAVFIIGLLLVSPYLFGNQLAKWLVKLQEEAIVEVEMSSEDGEKINLNIPQLYIIKEHNKEQGGGKNDALTFIATLNDMKPLPVATVKYSSTERYKQTPQNDPNIIAIQIKNIRSNINKKFIDDFYSRMTRDFPESVIKRNEMGLEITSAKIKLPSVNGGEAIIANVDMGIPANPDMQKILVYCDIQSCIITANIEPVSIVSIIFHPSKLSEWEEIYNKSTNLVKSFVSK